MDRIGGGVMSEVQMWTYLREKLSLALGMERLTDKLNDGIPDVVYKARTGEPGGEGWLELKYAARVADPQGVRIPWKSPAQPAILGKWARWGWRTGVLLRVGSGDWYYWRAGRAVAWVSGIQGRVPLETATWSCTGGLDVDGLLAALLE